MLTRYTMRSLKRNDGRSGGVCSVASPESMGMTCALHTVLDMMCLLSHAELWTKNKVYGETLALP